MAKGKVGDRYRNTSGAELYGLMPADAVAEVRQLDPGDEDSAHAGTVVLEYWLPDESGIGAAVGITDDELNANWEQV